MTRHRPEDARARRERPEGLPPGAGAEPAASLIYFRRAQAGDRRARDLLLQRYYSRVSRYVQRRMGRNLRLNRGPSDIVQEAMIRAIRNFDRYDVRDRRDLMRIFCAIVENQLRAASRRDRAIKRDRAREVPLDGPDSSPNALTDGLEARAHSPEQLVEAKEAAELMQAELKTLDPERRELVRLRVVEGLTWQEVARRTGAPSPEAARMKYERTRRGLRDTCGRRIGDSAGGCGPIDS